MIHLYREFHGLAWYARYTFTSRRFFVSSYSFFLNILQDMWSIRPNRSVYCVSNPIKLHLSKKHYIKIILELNTFGVLMNTWLKPVSHWAAKAWERLRTSLNVDCRQEIWEWCSRLPCNKTVCNHSTCWQMSGERLCDHLRPIHDVRQWVGSGLWELLLNNVAWLDSVCIFARIHYTSSGVSKRVQRTQQMKSRDIFFHD